MLLASVLGDAVCYEMPLEQVGSVSWRALLPEENLLQSEPSPPLPSMNVDEEKTSQAIDGCCRRLCPSCC